MNISPDLLTEIRTTLLLADREIARLGKRVDDIDDRFTAGNTVVEEIRRQIVKIDGKIERGDSANDRLDLELRNIPQLTKDVTILIQEISGLKGRINAVSMLLATLFITVAGGVIASYWQKPAKAIEPLPLTKNEFQANLIERKQTN